MEQPHGRQPGKRADCGEEEHGGPREPPSCGASAYLCRARRPRRSRARSDAGPIVYLIAGQPPGHQREHYHKNRRSHKQQRDGIAQSRAKRRIETAPGTNPTPVATM